MKFLPIPSFKKLIIGSVSCAFLGISILLTTTIADNGFINRYERVYSGGIIEISPVPFSDSTYSSSQSSFKDLVTKSTYTSNPLIPLDVIVSITEPKSIGITHTYIPVSTFGSTCGIIQSQIIVHNEEVMTPNIESSVVTTTSSNSSEIVRTGDLLPDTLYSYRIISKGCNKTASTYERSFITLPNPSLSERISHKNISYTSPFALPNKTDNNKKISITLYQPQSIGITHAYIPVSVSGSTCSQVSGYVTAAADSGSEYESKTTNFSLNKKTIVRIGGLLPHTTYSYSVTAMGCDTSDISYEKEFTTLKDPTITPPQPTSYSKKINTTSHISKATPIAPMVSTGSPLTPSTEYIEPSDTVITNTPPIDSEFIPEQNNQEEVEPFEEESVTKVKKINKVALPQTPREWIALLLLLVGTIGIITSFVHKRKPQI